MKLTLGLILGFTIGALCQLFGVPLPAPPVIEGAILVVAMSFGYVLADKYIKTQSKAKHLCGGPSGGSALERENRTNRRAG